MWGLISWILLGLIAGALAKLIYPGNQGGGIFATIILGILGALLGGWLGGLIFGTSGGATVGALTISSIIFAIIGAIILIFIWGLVTRSSAR
jgi:uncharacterized membrane protein YeaQ/YmgE (transglycosylase-associated protein family)